MVILKILRSSRNFSTGEKIFGFINVTLLLIFSITMIYPFLYIATVSITPIEVLSKHGNIMIFPRGFSLDAYKFILESGIIPQGFLNSVFVTITGTFINLMMTSLMAYPLSIKKLPGRKFWLLFVLIPMVFSGGLIPLFILIKSLGMYDTFLALIIPGAIATYYLLIMKSFFQKLPESLVESALIDGAGQFRIFYALIIPLSKPVMASMALFYGMGHWNDFFKALMFLSDDKKFTLPLILRNVLQDTLNQDTPDILEKYELLPGQIVKMAAVMLSVIPVLLVYPWLQKYFAKGVMLGSVKG